MQRLKDLVRITCLRRTKKTANLLIDIPPRIEKVEYVNLHPSDMELYAFFKQRTANVATGQVERNESGPKTGQSKENSVLSLINILRLICNHGEQLLPPAALEAWKNRGSTSIDWHMMQSPRKMCEVCGVDIDRLDHNTSKNLEASCNHLICTTGALSHENGTIENERMCPKCAMTSTSGANPRPQKRGTSFISPSAKVEALLRNLRAEQSTKDPGSLKGAIKRHVILNEGRDSLYV
jgi:SNF2 family DNA or RNA helicase